MTLADDTIEDHLMRAAADGDDRSMERLYARLSPALFNYLRKLGCSRDDADDVLQTAFVKAWQARTRFRGGGVRLWLFTITRNTWYSLARKQANTAVVSPASDFSTPEEEQSGRDLSACIDTALSQLPVDTREVVILSRVSGMDAGEIARLLDISEANVRVRLHRGLKHLRAELQQ
ncbi:MAG: RNA polymerase sigma factor [Pseudomonadota bacterium]